MLDKAPGSSDAKAAALHASSIVFDGLIVSQWGPDVFRSMKEGGITAANCTICVWEDFKATMLNVAQWQRWFSDHPDLIVQCRSVADIRRAKADGKVGIVFGWQNSSAMEDRVELLSVFYALGLRFVQLTYNTQNYIGAGCWEKNDGGLSEFGRDAIAEMNRLGIVVDLSHVAAKTAADAIHASKRPCAYTHICPAALFEHPRNKSDAQLREIVDHGGFVGIASYSPFMRSGDNTTIDDYLDLIEHAARVCGEGNIGIGTDFTEGQTSAFFDWVRKDKGVGRQMVPSKGVPAATKGFERLSQYPALTAAMMRRGWSDERIRNVLGENWMTFLERAW